MNVLLLHINARSIKFVLVAMACFKDAGLSSSSSTVYSRTGLVRQCEQAARRYVDNWSWLDTCSHPVMHGLMIQI